MEMNYPVVRKLEKGRIKFDFDFDNYMYLGESIEVELINYPDEWVGFHIGDKLPSGEIVQICTFHESTSAWVIVKANNDDLYEIDIPYSLED